MKFMILQRDRIEYDKKITDKLDFNSNSTFINFMSLKVILKVMKHHDGSKRNFENIN